MVFLLFVTSGSLIAQRNLVNVTQLFNGSVGDPLDCPEWFIQGGPITEDLGCNSEVTISDYNTAAYVNPCTNHCILVAIERLLDNSPESFLLTSSNGYEMVLSTSGTLSAVICMGQDSGNSDDYELISGQLTPLEIGITSLDGTSAASQALPCSSSSICTVVIGD